MTDEVVLPAPILASLMREDGAYALHGNSLGLLFGQTRRSSQRVLGDGDSAAQETVKEQTVINSLLPIDTTRFVAYGELDTKLLGSVIAAHKRRVSEVVGLYSIRPNSPLTPSIKEYTWTKRLEALSPSLSCPVLLLVSASFPIASALYEAKRQTRVGMSVRNFLLDKGRLRPLHTYVPSLPSTSLDYSSFVSTGAVDATAAERKVFGEGFKATSSLVENKLEAIERAMKELQALDRQFNLEANRKYAQ